MILYNGSTGSLARYFAEAARVAGIPTTPIRSRLEEGEGFRAELGLLRDAKPEKATFIHFAAKVSVPWCENHPEETRRINVDATVETTRIFVETCRKFRVEASLIYVSSAHIYARNDASIHETDPLVPRSVYAKSKLEAERALMTLAEEYGLSIRIPRVFGLVAPIQPDHYVLHALLRRARAGAVHGIPGLANERDYVDSRDVCRAITAIATLDESRFARVCPDRAVNVASARAITIRALAEKCVRSVHPTAEANKLIGEMTEAPPRADDAPRIVAAIDRYQSLFGENPSSIPIERTIHDALTGAITR